LRDQVYRKDKEALMRLAADQEILETQPARSLILLARALRDQGNRDRAEQVLRRAWRLDPSGF
jgi:Flp pilus assembly protein TadD